MSGKRYYDDSLRPPPEGGDGDGKVDSWDWGEALIDCTAYMIEESNHTSARCAFFDKKKEEEEELQVTFCLASPPHISYFCIGYTSGEPTEFVKEPMIIATEGNLALITLKHGSTDPAKCNYFVYRAPIHGDEPPMLSRLPLPDPELFLPRDQRFFYNTEVGILRYSTRKGSEQPPFTPPTPSLTLAPATTLARRHKSNSDDCDAYKIASLYSRAGSTGWVYDLYTYDSKVDAWAREATAFSQPPPEWTPTHLIDKVITIDGTMGWVNLWCSLLLCDVHVPGEEMENPNTRPLRYIPLPEPRQPDNDLPLCGTAPFFRDIAVVQGHIKFVDLQIHASPGSLIPNGWTAVTWSLALDGSCFIEESELRSIDIDSPLEPSLFVGHPRLSSQYDGILYLMTKVDLRSHESRVIAVNMKTKQLEAAAKFTTQRSASMHVAFNSTTLSKYLTPDSKRIVKRRGPAMRGSSRKKPQPAIIFMSPKQPSGYGGDQVEEGEKKNLPSMGDDGDSMDLE